MGVGAAVDFDGGVGDFLVHRQPFAGMIHDLTDRVAWVANENDPAAVLRRLSETLSGWMAPLVEAAASAVVTAFQPARPPLAWSSVAKRRAML